MESKSDSPLAMSTPSGGALPHDNYVRFDSFYWSFLNTFMILSGENWDTMYYLTSTVAWVSSPLFFLTWILLGQYILLNLVMVGTLSLSL